MLAIHLERDLGHQNEGVEKCIGKSGKPIKVRVPHGVAAMGNRVSIPLSLLGSTQNAF